VNERWKTMARGISEERASDRKRKGRPGPAVEKHRSGAREQDRLKEGRGDKVQEDGSTVLPCADMTCPCRVVKKQEILLPERCLKR
jgi:hypothetical protein